MTRETKNFIELSDITALCLTCRHCKAELHVTLDELPREGALSRCPNCQRPWAQVSHNQLSSHDYAREIVGFMDVLLETRKIADKQAGLGFSLTFEIKATE
jgi:predicted Zn finger-like uncharacterized protein